MNRRIMAIAWPVMLSALSQALLTNIDFVMVGQISTDALAAVGVAGTFMTIFFIVGNSLSFGLSTCVSMRLGEQDRATAGRVAVHGLIFGVLLGLALFATCRSVLGLVFGSMDLEPAVRQLTLDYSRVFVFGLLVSALGGMAGATFGAYTKTRPVLIASLIMVAVNLVGDYVLIFGKLGFPAMGVRGAAWASVSAVFCSTAYLLVMLACSVQAFELSLPRSPAAFGRTVATILRLGISTTIEWSLWFVGVFVITVWLSPFGAVPLALFHVSIKVQNFLMLAVRGFVVANNAMIGRAHGGRQPRRIALWHHHNLRLGYISIIPGLLLLLVFPGWLFGWFIPLEELEQIGSPWWLGVAVAGVLVVRMINTIAGSSLRSVGVVTFFVYLLLASQGLALGTGLLTLKGAAWGFWGALLATAVDESFRAAVSAVKLRRMIN